MYESLQVQAGEVVAAKVTEYHFFENLNFSLKITWKIKPFLQHTDWHFLHNSHVVVS